MRLIRHQLDLKLGWISRRSTGDLLAVTDSDASQAIWILGPLPYGTGVSLLLVGTVVLIFSLDPWLGLLTLASVVAIVASRSREAGPRSRSSRRIQKLRSEVSDVAHESFDGALTVKALGSRGTSRPPGSPNVAATLRNELVSVGRIFTFYRAIADSIPQVAMVLLLVAGAFRIRAGVLSPGDMVSVAYLFSLSAVPVRLVGYVIWEMASSLAGWERVEDVLKCRRPCRLRRLSGDARHATGPRSTASRSPSPMAETIPILRGRSIRGDPRHHRRGRRRHWLGQDHPDAAAGAAVGPRDGSISLDGRDLRNFARSELSGEVAYVPQHAFLFDDTVAGNITLGRISRRAEVEEAARLAGAHDSSPSFRRDTTPASGNAGPTLSGGQQQRIALARALGQQAPSAPPR